MTTDAATEETIESTPLATLPTLDDATAERLHRRLETDAEADGIVDVAYRTIDSPFGSLLLAATDAGLVRVAYETEDHEQVLAGLAAKVGPRVLRVPKRLDAVATEIDEYFIGRRQEFDVPIDLRLTRGAFYRNVLGHLQGIAYGTTASYTSLAALAGSPKAVRAVGSACATNPVPIVVPCHRVLRSDGKIGQYLGGLEVKRRLLQMEAAA
jgi:methylated-DNA-[protein]-cysteine S-methyltransferase